ncbi:MAG TPA: hypothetical protein VMG08_07335 [Allosphingosinicella sp.]|nr:hypothetical protein [Allosphingosinicella sp.]
MRRLLLAAALALAATPAAGADLATLSCPADSVTEAQRAAIAEAMRNRQPDHPGVRPLDEALAACAQRLGWSAETADIAKRYHGAMFNIAIMRRRLVAAGVALGALERLLLADEALIGAVHTDRQQAEMNRFVEANTPFLLRLLEGRAGDTQTMIGQFSGYVAAAEKLRREFIAG